MNAHGDRSTNRTLNSQTNTIDSFFGIKRAPLDLNQTSKKRRSATQAPSTSKYDSVDVDTEAACDLDLNSISKIENKSLNTSILHDQTNVEQISKFDVVDLVSPVKDNVLISSPDPLRSYPVLLGGVSLPSLPVIKPSKNHSENEKINNFLDGLETQSPLNDPCPNSSYTM